MVNAGVRLALNSQVYTLWQVILTSHKVSEVV